MNRMRWIMLAVGLGGVLAVLPVSAQDVASEDNIASSSDEIASGLLEQTASSLEDLRGRFRAEQVTYMSITPMSVDFPLCQGCGMLVFDPAMFPESFSEKLVGELQYDCPVYQITLAEDPDTREIVCLNENGEEIARLKPEDGYSPTWLLDKYFPDLHSGKYDEATIKALTADYDPSLIRISFTLLPVDYVEAYAEGVANEQAMPAVSLRAGRAITPMMMYQGPAVTNLQLVAIEKKTNGMLLTLAYPSDFTNQVDFFTCSDLVGFWWNVAGTTNVNTSTNWIEWLDTNALSQTLRFYAAGDANLDTDGDGLTDAREKYLYHTSSTTNDTDGDGLSDYYEIMTLNTDPNNSKTNKPIVSISYPSNESRKVWLP